MTHDASEARGRVAEALYLWWQADDGDLEPASWRAIGRQGQTFFREGADAALAALDDTEPRGCPTCAANHPASRYRGPKRCADSWHDSWPRQLGRQTTEEPR